MLPAREGLGAIRAAGDSCYPTAAKDAALELEEAEFLFEING